MADIGPFVEISRIQSEINRLFDNRLGFSPAARFTVYPQLFGVTLHDLGAEEAFLVYDHPPVMIFRHVRRLSWNDFRAQLCGPPRPAACG